MEEGQATSCPHRVLRCTAPHPILSRRPKPSFPPPRDRPFRASLPAGFFDSSTPRLLDSSTARLPCSSAPLPLDLGKDCLRKGLPRPALCAFCTCRVTSWNYAHTTCQSLTTSTLGYRTSLVGAAAPSSHISSARYTHSHWHEHEDEYSLGRTRAHRRVHQRSLHQRIHLFFPAVAPALRSIRLLLLPNVFGPHRGIQHKYDATNAVPQAFRSCAHRDHLQGAPQGRPSR